MVVLPLGASGYKAAFNVSTTLFSVVFIIETLLSLALAINNQLPFFESSNSFGLSPALMLFFICCAFVSKSMTLSQPQQLIYKIDLSGDNKQLYASAGNFIFLSTSFVFISIRYKELSSLVTVYKICFFSSNSMPAGDANAFPFAINEKLSVSNSLPVTILYTKIRLSFPPLTYRFLLSSVNFNPYQLLGITTSSSCLHFFVLNN